MSFAFAAFLYATMDSGMCCLGDSVYEGAGWPESSYIFRAMGKNSIAIYTVSELLPAVLQWFYVDDGSGAVHGVTLWRGLQQYAFDTWGSPDCSPADPTSCAVSGTIFGLFGVVLMLLMAWIMDRRRIYFVI